jgi:hypothetical protein
MFGAPAADVDAAPPPTASAALNIGRLAIKVNAERREIMVATSNPR